MAVVGKSAPRSGGVGSGWQLCEELRHDGVMGCFSGTTETAGTQTGEAWSDTTEHRQCTRTLPSAHWEWVGHQTSSIVTVLRCVGQLDYHPVVGPKPTKKLCSWVIATYHMFTVHTRRE